MENLAREILFYHIGNSTGISYTILYDNFIIIFENSKGKFGALKLSPMQDAQKEKMSQEKMPNFGKVVRELSTFEMMEIRKKMSYTQSYPRYPHKK